MTDKLEDIIKGCLAGKSSARERLYNLFAGKMWPICLRYSKNSDEAKDVMQEGFIKVFEKIAQFEGRGPFEGWLRRIMVNTALAEYRKTHYLYMQSENSYNKNDLTYEPIETNICVAELMDIVNELSPQYKMVFNLYAIEGYTHKEIAEMLGINEGTSKSNLSRAREILQKKIAVYYQTTEKIG